MKYLKLFCLLIFAFAAHGQTDTIVRYWMYSKSGTSPMLETKDSTQAVTRAVYYRKDGLWKMESRYIKSGLIYMTASYSDAKCTQNEGELVAFYFNGKMSFKSFYVSDKESGLHQAWHLNGMKKDSFYMKDGIITGKGFSWDSTGKIVSTFDLDEEGTGSVTYFNEKYAVRSKGGRVKGKSEGKWDFYSDEGYREWEVVYAKDSVISAVCFDANGKAKENCIFEREAVPLGGNYAWKVWLAKEIGKYGYPSRKFSKHKTAAELSGEVRVKMLVDKDGKIIEAEIVKSLNEEADKIALKVILSAPAWVPAIQRNKLVKFYATQPITFVVNDEK
jgi:TonB family protein